MSIALAYEIHTPSTPWSIIFLKTLWNLRKQRCATLFNDQELDHALHNLCSSRSREFYQLQEQEKIAKMEGILVRWYPPQEHWIKLNSDGAVDQASGRAGAGSVSSMMPMGTSY